MKQLIITIFTASIFFTCLFTPNLKQAYGRSELVSNIPLTPKISISRQNKSQIHLAILFDCPKTCGYDKAWTRGWSVPLFKKENGTLIRLPIDTKYKFSVKKHITITEKLIIDISNLENGEYFIGFEIARPFVLTKKIKLTSFKIKDATVYPVKISKCIYNRTEILEDAISCDFKKNKYSGKIIPYFFKNKVKTKIIINSISKNNINIALPYRRTAPHLDFFAKIFFKDKNNKRISNAVFFKLVSEDNGYLEIRPKGRFKEPFKGESLYAYNFSLINDSNNSSFYKTTSFTKYADVCGELQTVELKYDSSLRKRYDERDIMIVPPTFSDKKMFKTFKPSRYCLLPTIIFMDKNRKIFDYFFHAVLAPFWNHDPKKSHRLHNLKKQAIIKLKNAKSKHLLNHKKLEIANRILVDKIRKQKRKEELSL